MITTDLHAHLTHFKRLYVPSADRVSYAWLFDIAEGRRKALSIDEVMPTKLPLINGLRIEDFERLLLDNGKAEYLPIKIDKNTKQMYARFWIINVCNTLLPNELEALKKAAVER